MSRLGGGLKKKYAGGVNVYNLSESLKEKQARYREAREKRSAQLGPAHEVLIQNIAGHVGLRTVEVTEFILDSEDQIQLMNSFVTAGGNLSLTVFYQKGDAPRLESGRTIVRQEILKKVFATSGGNEAATCKIIFYIKTQNDRNLTAKSMVDEMSYAMLDLEQHEGLLPALKSLMSQINLPQLSACSDWGPMVKTLQGQKNKDEFLQGLEAFINYLENADSNVRGAVYLQDVIEVDVSHITSAQECKEAAKNIDLVEKLEQLVMGWRDQIEQVLGESEQMRKEADDTGPLAELEYWRFLMSKFNSLFDCLKKPRCRAVINTLNAAKSKVVRTWRDMDAKITDNANEAKDNVRYLYALENECGKLYHSQPLGMIEIIPSLINIISMIRDVSKYYNTPQRLTSLFVKVTNQMVSGCRKYLTNNNKTKIWDQEPDVVKKNITECICVSTEYKKAFHNMNQPKNSTDEKSELSEMYIFGKLETFCKRLYQIQDYLDTVERFSVLANSGIEGMEPLGNRLLGLITLMKKKPYDILDFRKPDFEDDYAVFRDGICELEAMINNFLDVAFKRTRGSLQGLLILKKFENFNIYCLKDVIADKYFQALNRYTAEIEDVKKRYKRLHDEPPIARNMPPVSGKVLWARQLFRKIREPMESIIKFSPEILKEREGKKICHSYNTVGKTLMEFEVLYYRAWCREAENIKNCLQATLLVKDEDQNIFLNFDPQIAEMTRESMCIQKMGLELPATTIDLLRRSNVLKLCQSRLTRILQTYNDVKSSIPLVFQPSLKGQLKEVQRAVSHGLIFATWTSLNHEAYFGEVERKIALLKKKVEILVDLRQTRIIDICQEIIDTEYMELDETYPLLLFLKRMKEKVAWMTNFLNGKCEYVENATKDLVSLLRRFSSKGSSAEDDDEEEPVKSKAETSKEEENFLQECAEMIDFFKMKTYDAIVKGIKLAVESLKKRTQLYNKSQFNRGDSDNVSKNPLLEISIELNKPNVELKPTIEEVQHTINECARMMVDVGKGIPLWAVDGGADDPADAPTDQSDLTKRRNPRNLHKTVTDNKDVTKTVMMLSSTMNSLRQPVQKALVRFSEFKYLWELDLQTEMTAFKATKPLIVDYKAEILKFANVAGKIDLVDKNIIVGPLSLNCANVKASLKKEAAVWKKSLCSLLNAEYRPHMFEVSSLVEDYLKKLSRPIRDLDDIRESMASLDKLKHEYIRVDFLLGPIEETYSILQKFGLEVNAEEQNKADSLRFDWDRLQVQATQVSNHLLDVQPKFRSDLIDKISEFQLDLENFKDAYLTEGPMEVGISAQEASDRVQVFSSEFADLNRKFTQNASGEELFGLEVRSYPFLNKVKREMTLLQKLYGLYNQVMKSVNGYYELLWSEVDIEAINTELTDFSTRCRKLPKGLKSWPAFNVLKKKIDDFSETCPLLEVMANPAMKKRHWNRMDVQCNYKFDVENENYTLKSIVTAPLLKYKEEIEDICTSAVKEKDIESKLNQVVNEWSAHKFYFAQFKTRGELLLKGQETMELIGFLEDSLMILSSLMGNRYNAPFKPTIALWVQKLSNTNDIIENWLIVQNLWVYLEAVFVGGDIAKELPQEAKRFQNIDKTWMKLMSRAKDIKMVVPCCVSDETMGQTLPHLLEQLESCQKSLTGYLEAKRLIFPRFFFVSDPALLEILGQASDSHSIQAHLTGIFENVYLVGFHETEYDKMISVISREKEEIMLKKPVMGKGHVESWLGELLREQQHSLHCVIGDGYTQLVEPDFDLFAYLDSAPAQVGLLALQMLWTKESETALENCKTDKKIMNNTNNRFLKVLNDLIATTTRDLGKFERIKYETCITIHVHQRDIFNDLVRLHIKVLNDFEWLKQSRFYFNVDLDVCVVSITNVNFSYCNEFLGCTDRLVITPLTDRCYITLAQALFMHMGSAPAGPAGTGKTETTKDMGKALGKYVVVFNCSDQMDFRGLGRIYKGLAQSGSWGCFDEFNRIDLPVLSVAAQQIYIVLQAKKDHKTTFIFTDGDSVSLDPEFGLFITMNPGYAGRQELPENLKVQFRTVSMMVPDRQIIMRVKLASCGFIENIVLAQKFYTLYKLCEEQLTKQVHYDFGLRNILSVLRTLGAAKRKRPDDSETTIVMRGLRDMNLSKLVDEDEPLFLSLISDLFPGIVLETADYVDLQAAIQANVKSMNCVNHPNWNLKVVQLFETQNVRHGMMTLGPSGAGKTLCINMIMRAMSACGTPHREVRMNPKSITAPQMFGRLDVATNDWTDGIFSTLWRRSHKTKKGEKLWIILDGPVDAIWIENLNSVLDDNKTLTLANGDRIVMAPTCKILFEVHNIDNASPATVSRVGMVFMSSSVLDWKPILEGWIMTRPASEQEMLRSLFHSMFEDAYNFVMQSCIPKMALYQCNYIVQAGNVLEGSIPPKEACGKNFTKHVEHLFVFSLMWSVGALLELEDRYRLQQFIRNHKSKLDLPKMEEGSGRTIFEYVPNVNGTWDHWSARLVEYEYPKDHVPEYTGILVPNVDNVRTRHLIDIISKQGKGVLLIGEQGTGKTVVVKGYMNDFNSEEMLSKSLNFSSATEPGMFQTTVESYVDKRMGTTYGPSGGRKMTVFVDDINMPVINDWGDQITNEVVRQQMEQRGMYSLEKPGDFSNIVDLQFIAAMIHPGGGRNDIPERLKRQFSVFNCTLPSNASIDKIFGIIGEGYFCEERGFTAAVIAIVPELVPLTRLLWQATKFKLLATPAKFHYIFNLRDLSRIWQGILSIRGDVATEDLDMLRLFKHECMRVIADRFVSSDDTKWFENKMTQIIRENLGDKYADFAASIEPWFVDFLREAEEPEEGAGGEGDDDGDAGEPKIYEPIPPLNEFSAVLKAKQMLYNEYTRGARLDLVFFKDAMTHLIKISRIIRTPRGSALLVGVGGSGKQSLTRLATFIAGYDYFQIAMTRTYNASNLLDDLKALYRKAGVEGVGVSFIFTDNDIKEEGFLEYLNNILSTGEVSGLFARDELDEITNDLIAVLKKEDPKRIPTQEVLYEYFMTRAKSNLHIVLCFSPIGEQFRTRALKFPGLFSCCTMDWFTKWPREALVSVSRYIVSKFPIVCSNDIKELLYASMGSFHDTAASTCVEYYERFRRVTHVTPKSYLSFLGGYSIIYFERYDLLEGMSSRMDTGLLKLLDAGESVALLSLDLVVKEKDLEVATEAANVVLKEVTESATAAEVIKNEVLVVKQKAQGIVDMIAVEKAAAQEKLQAAEPALKAAEEALNTIKSSDISTIRKLAKPPHLIMRIMDAVLILFQANLGKVEADADKGWLIKPSWNESLKVMSSSGFMNNLKFFDKDTINAETIDLLSVYFDVEDYNYDNAKKVCGNVAGLLSWTIAMSSFYSINKEVLPLKAKLAKAEAKLQGALKDLAQAQALLDEKQAELDATQQKFDSAMRAKQLIIEDAEMCRYKMSMAKQLIDGLSGEKVRWTAQSKQFKLEILSLVGDSLLATGFLSYSGPFNQDFRTYLIKEQWQQELKREKIPFTHTINLITMLSDAPTIGEWNLEGLPNDDLSIQNGIIVTKASRYPLLIDPQGQGKAWIKRREEKNRLIVTTLTHKWFKTHLEDALGQGRPLLIQDVTEEIDPALDNVLEKNFIRSGKNVKVKVGDKEIDVMPGFSLYMTTKLANPSYTPEVSAKASIINFTVTMQGLEDQLLGRVILTEKQELETEKLQLMEDVTAYRRKMKELEDNLLYKLTSTEGSLVEDVSLIEMLRNTKETANEVHEKLTVAAETEIKINGAREEFRPVASRGSILYFLVVEMSMVNLMYQTSLNQFLGLFDKSMATATRSPVTSKRIENIIEALTYIVFRYSCRGLFNDHKLLFTLMMALKIDIRKGTIKPREFQTLIKGGAALDLKSVTPKPCKWILDVTWLNLCQLAKLPEFRDILDQITRNEKEWRRWFDTEAPETEIIPDGYNASLDTFRRLILIRCWCIDRVLPQSRLYISKSLGKKYAEPVILDMDELHSESAPDVPMICFLSQGSDPTEQICVLAKKMGLECHCISMGQGQEIHGRRLLQNCFVTGHWALFQNCHLGLSFMDELLDRTLTVEDPVPTFRLWITAEEHPKFPIQILQSSIKFTNDPPLGVRAGLLRTFASIPQDFIDITNMPQWRPLLFAVGFLHTVVQERRKFGPLGWNIPYEFNSSDHYSVTLFIQNHLDEIDKKKGVQWNTTRYMIAEVQYGGRVTDDYDKHLLSTFANVWFSENLFKEGFTFYGEYMIPVYRTSQEVMAAIAELPETDTPEVFGLHKNAEITYQAKTATNILQTIMNIQPKDSGGGAGESRESVVFRQAEDMLSRLPANFVQHEVKTRLNKMGLHNALVIFLKQELQRMQRVITKVRLTLIDLMLAIEGTIIMSENLREALDSLFDANIPSNWIKISWISSSIGFWFTELVERSTQLYSWVYEGRPICFWMTGFFNPQGFLTAMRQEVTRMHKGWALDTVALHNDVLKSPKEDITVAPTEGVFVYGLFLDGASWERRTARLCESSPKILFVQLPVVHIYAINSLAPKNPDLYACPVYKKPRRTDLTYITPLWLKTNKPPTHWTLRGVALLCDIK